MSSDKRRHTRFYNRDRYAAPVTAAADTANEYGNRIGTDISVYEGNDEYYLFLPSSADISAVKLRYNGSLKMYDPDNGTLYESGDIMPYDCSAGEISVYEYDSEKNMYYRYRLKVMQGENIATIYVTLDNGDDGLRHINSSHDVRDGKHGHDREKRQDDILRRTQQNEGTRTYLIPVDRFA